MIRGLRSCRAYTRGRVRVGSDSQLLVKQMQQTWKVRQPELQSLHREAAVEAVNFESVHYRNYDRSHPQISRVDRLLNAMLDRVRDDH